MKYKNFEITDSLGRICKKQTNLFSVHHEKHNLTITVKVGENTYKKRFTYQFNPEMSYFKNGQGVYATVCDAVSYMGTKNLSEFCKEFGYNDLAQGRRAYLGCKSAYDFFIKCGISDTDLDSLWNIVNELETF